MSQKAQSERNVKTPPGSISENPENRAELFELAHGREIPEKRGENVKHFSLGANRYTAVMYPEPVHYREEGSSRWQEIDNTLVEAVSASGQPVFRNRANSMHVELTRSPAGGNLVRLEHNGHTLEWTLCGAAAAAPAIRQGADIRRERLIQRAMRMPKFVGRMPQSFRDAELTALETPQERRLDRTLQLSSEALYENILPGLTARYTLAANTLKEDLILAGKDALAHAALLLPDTYTYIPQQDGGVSVLDPDSGEESFRFDPPLVFDAEGRKTVAGVTLTPEDRAVRMAYSLDTDFLDAAVFPVTIDPVTHSSGAKTNVEYSCVMPGNDSTYPEWDHVKVGAYNGSECVSLIRLKTLAPLKAGDTVVQATLYLYPKSSSSSKYVAAHPVYKPWSRATATWANFNPNDASNVGAEAIECRKGSSSSSTPLAFDLTNLYRRWCMLDDQGASQNHGVALRTPANISGDNYSELYSPAASSAYHPVMYVYYVSHAGTEDWWQYEQRSAGRAGSVSADLFNGNMVLAHSDTQMTGSRNPVSVSHIYNSCLSDKNAFACGCGWKTTAHQKITSLTLNDKDYFVWEDGDGAEHFFEQSGAQPWEDLEGMDLKLTMDSAQTCITITDKGHNQMVFRIVQTHLAWLESARDANGNEISYTYVSGYEAQGRISRITDPAGRETVFSYSGSLLSSIRIPDSSEAAYRYTYFTYDSSDRLTGVRYSDLGGSLPHTVYSYDGTTAMLTRARNYDGVCVDVGYEAASRYNLATFDQNSVTGTDQMRRVLSLETLHVNDAGAVTLRGAKQTFAYRHMATEVTAVENASSDAGKKLVYQFNDSGNVVGIRDELGFGQFTKYESDIENKPSEASRLRKAVVNLLRRIDFGAEWTAASGTVLQDNTVTCMSMPSVKMAAENIPTEYRQQVVLKANTPYTFSAYVKTQNAIEEGAAYLCLARTDNALDNVCSELIFGTTDAASGNEMPTDGWRRVQLQMNHTAGTDETYYASMHFGSGLGTAWFACPQLEEGTTAGAVNIISNGDFRYTYASGAQTAAYDWTKGTNNLTTAPSGVQAAGSDASFPAALSGNYIQVEGRPDKESHVGYVQTLHMQGKAGDVLVVGGWGSARSVPGANSMTRGFGIAMRLKKADGTWSPYVMCPFNEEWVDWQYASFALTAPFDYILMEMVLNYTGNCNLAKFTNIFLHREAFGQSFAYDDDKNVVSTGNLAGQKSGITYDSFDNVLTYAQPGRDSSQDANLHKFHYGDTDAEKKRHLPRRIRTPMNVADYVDYDSYGNSLNSRRIDYATYTGGTDETSAPYIRTENTYTADGNYPATAKDARGNTVTTATNPLDGTTTSVTDPTGQTVQYAYDASKRVTSVQTAADGKTYKNTYTYENDRIHTVSHNTTGDSPDVTYTFAYDDLGRKTTVKVSTQTLSTNVYKNDRNALLSRVEYGNGGKVQYAYDDFDRMTGIQYDGESANRYQYEYGSNGAAARVTDANLNRSLTTEYDLADRPCATQLKDAAGNLLYRTTLLYDKLGNLARFSEQKGVSSYYNTAYEYDRDNRVTQMNFGGNRQIAYSYDALGRIVSRTATSGGAYATGYGYVSGGYGTNSTTPLVDSISQPGMNLAYQYDSRGNITAETRNNLTTTYAYDALGQLIRVNDPHENATWVYDYDRGGNIVSKAKYAYTTGTLGTALETIPYTYGDANWKDKLTAFNGQAITYDAIGNPGFVKKTRHPKLS